ncbi:MAG: cell division protein FtsL [Sedimenticola sp.]|nr:MAG: cell division protein FtsL [Sedimenticola sp.]
MNRRQFITLLLLGLMVLSSAIGVVYAKYASRKYFVELKVLQAQRDAIEIEWGRLQIEQSTWGTHGRIEKIATKDLKMHIPSTAEVLVIRP